MPREKRADEIFCESCGEPIKKVAEICPHCGVRNIRYERASTQMISKPQRKFIHAPSQYETTVSENWYYLVGACTALWVIGFVLMEIWEGAAVLIFIIAWIGLPIGIYFDMQYVRANSRWNPNTIGWLILSIIWFVNIIAGLVYLYRRHETLGIP